MKPISPASALARLRWAGTTPEQRREATAKARKASPRTKVRICPSCGGPLLDLRSAAVRDQLAARAESRCFAWGADAHECHGTK